MYKTDVLLAYPTCFHSLQKKNRKNGFKKRPSEVETSLKWQMKYFPRGNPGKHEFMLPSHISFTYSYLKTNVTYIICSISVT